MKSFRSLVLLVAVMLGAWTTQAQFTLQILHNNDGESSLLDDAGIGAVDNFAFIVDSLRGEAASNGWETVTLSSGDNFLAGPEFNASLDNGLPYYDAVAMDEIGYDAICLGNHDFDFGPDELENFINSFSSTSPTFLSANLDFSMEPGLDALVTSGDIAASTVVTVGAQQVGVIGLTTPNLPFISSPRDVMVDDQIVTIVQAEVTALQMMGVNNIILISHLQGLTEELDLAAQLTGVDVIIAGGGDELLTNDPSIANGNDIFGAYPLVAQDAAMNDVYVVTGKGAYEYIGQLVVDFDAAGNITAVNGISNPLLVTNGSGSDTDVNTNVVTPVAAYTAALYANVIGSTEPALDGRRNTVRARECNEGNLIADAFLWQANQLAASFGVGNADVALANGGGIRNDNVVAAGSDISEGTTFDFLPFANFLTVVPNISSEDFLQIMENCVSKTILQDGEVVRSGDGTGRFSQIAGFRIEYDVTAQPLVLDETTAAVITPGVRVRNIELSDGTDVVVNGVAQPGVTVNIAIVDFLARGGDQFFHTDADGPGLEADEFTILGVTYQQTLENYIVNELSGSITAAQYPEGGEGRINAVPGCTDNCACNYDPIAEWDNGTCTFAAAGFDCDGVAIPTQDIELNKLGSYTTGIFDDSAAEIVDYHIGSQRAFFCNAGTNSVVAVSLADPTALAFEFEIDLSTYGDGVNSVVVFGDHIAVAEESGTTGVNGTVEIFDIDGNHVKTLPAGDLPDAITVTPNGDYLLVANEGEPDNDYIVDPEGSVTIVDVSNGAAGATASQVSFSGITMGDLDASTRIFGLGASIAQDLEPEYIAVDCDNNTAYVSCQENNCVVEVEISTGNILDVWGYGYIDHALDGNELDASNDDGAVNIQNWPVLGMPLPDAIATYAVNGQSYIVTANEGDARDYDGYSEEDRIRDVVLDPTAFPDAATLQADENLGRLKLTLAQGDDDNDGDFDTLYSFGTRSFSIYDNAGNLVFDSGSDFEKIMAERYVDLFNANNDDNTSFDNRSDDKGPEPEAVAIGEINGRQYAFIGLERAGGVMVYDITVPVAAQFETYINTRDPLADEATDEDLGPESIKFIAAADSPNGNPLIIVSYEVSGNISVFEVGATPASTFALQILHNNDGESDLLPDGDGIGGAAQFKAEVDALRADAVTNGWSSIMLSSGDNFLAGPEFQASLDNGLPYYDAVAMEAIAYDAVCIGNHDFDFGPDILANFINSYTMAPPYLSANLDYAMEPVLDALETAGILQANTIVTKDGQEIGVIGLTTPNLPFISSPRDVVVDPAVVAIVQAQVAALNAAGVNKIILISHLQGIEEDLDLASQVYGVDVVIAGGGDELLINDASQANGSDIYGAYPLVAQDACGEDVLVVTTSGSYDYVGQLVVNFDNNGNITEVNTVSDAVLVDGAAGSDATLDADVTTPVQTYVDALEANVIATTEVDLDGRRNTIRAVESNEGNLIADAFLAKAQALAASFGVDAPQVALANGGGIRNDDVLLAGSDFTEGTTFDWLPFPNFLTVVENVSAEDFKELLENAYSKTIWSDGQVVRSGDGTGRFAQVGGMTVIYDVNAQPLVLDVVTGDVITAGERIISVELDNGTQVVVDGVAQAGVTVDLVTVDFLARGGDQYFHYDADGVGLEADEFTILGVTYQQALFDYVSGDLGGAITAADYPEGGEGRINPLPENNTPDNAVAVVPTAFGTCNPLTADLSFSTGDGSNGTNDLWYSFVAPTSGVRVEVATTDVDVTIELRDAAQALVTTEDVQASAGNEALNFGSLTPGATYFVAVATDDAVADASFDICIQFLAETTADFGSGPYDLCDIYKADWVGADNYRYNFFEAGTANLVSSVERGSPSTLFFLRNADLSINTTYDVVIDAGFNVTDGTGASSLIWIEGTQTNTVIMGDHPALALRNADNCANAGALFLGAYVKAVPFACNANDLTFEFTRTDVTEMPITVQKGNSNSFLRLSSVPGLAEGATYDVRVKPEYADGATTTFGSVQCIQIVGAAPGITAEGPVVEMNEEVERVEAPAQRAVTLFPNPVNGGTLNIDLTAWSDAPVQAFVYDAFGKRVAEHVLFGAQQETIAVNELAVGLYTLELVKDGSRTALRFAVAK